METAKITGTFETRRQAEMAMERLVQNENMARTAIVMKASGSETNSGAIASGAKVDHGQPTSDENGGPELNGAVALSVSCDPGMLKTVETVLQDAGGLIVPERENRGD